MEIETGIGGVSAQLAAPAESGETWVLDVLEPDQLVAAKEKERYGLRELGLGTRILMWGMRAYVLFMTVVVAYQIWTTVTHAAAGN